MKRVLVGCGNITLTQVEEVSASVPQTSQKFRWAAAKLGRMGGSRNERSLLPGSGTPWWPQAGEDVCNYPRC